ncbi:hypothetical protein BKA57DRAFT_82072 [Linnemannia elongata]|nr:hypothetical protein BKA57DRAFT_82072 [Linnemannia elongata]
MVRTDGPEQKANKNPSPFLLSIIFFFAFFVVSLCSPLVPNPKKINDVTHPRRGAFITDRERIGATEGKMGGEREDEDKGKGKGDRQTDRQTLDPKYRVMLHATIIVVVELVYYSIVVSSLNGVRKAVRRNGWIGKRRRVGYG